MSGFNNRTVSGTGEMCSNDIPFNLTSLPETITTVFPGKPPFRLHAVTDGTCNALKSNITTNTLVWTPVLGPNAKTRTEGDASNMTVYMKSGSNSIVWVAAEEQEDPNNATSMTNVYWTGNYTFMTQEEMDQKKVEDEAKEKENGSISMKSLSLKGILLFGLLGLGVATL